MMPQQYCLRWKHHHSNVQNMFAQLLEKERFCDVTLYCSPSFATQVSGKDTVEPHHIRGVSLRAHRVVLAACSELLGGLLGAHEAQGEPVLVIDGAEPKHLKALLDYMYTGEMNVHHSQLASLLKTAEELRIKGLTDIRWNNKDEPPDSDAGNIITTTTASPIDSKSDKPKSPKRISPKRQSPKLSPEAERKRDDEADVRHEKFSFNGGPPLPPLIKLPTKDKTNSHKREHRSDSDSPSPKRHRLISGTEPTDEEIANQIKLENNQEWQHGNMDITASRVVGWGMTPVSRGSTSRDVSDDEWADAPADIGSFLHTKLSVDGDNSADEESNESVPPQTAGSSSSCATSMSSELRVEMAKAQLTQLGLRHAPPTSGPKSGPTDPRFTDVVKLSDYLQHGRRPQFWEENYVKRVMESVRLKELEMKQAAEILGVSYGTLYGRYRDVYGCINRPYSNVTSRAVRDFWQAKGPSEVLDRLQRGEMSLDSAAQALGVSIGNLAAHLADFGALGDKEFEPIPIEMDPALKARSRTYSAGTKSATRRPTIISDKPTGKKVIVGSVSDEEAIPATVISTQDVKPALSPASAAAAAISGKWPTIRVASLDTLRGGDTSPLPPAAPPAPPAAPPAPPASPSALMRTRPDLTIVAKKNTEKKEEETT